ncbi:MAG: GGDEF domain-containing protein [bacterium]
MEFDDATKIIRKEAAPEIGERDEKRGYLIALSGPNTGEMYELEGLTIIGRTSEATIALTDDGVSRIHCRLEKREDGSVVLRDAGSTNGTYVNGDRVEERVLADGDKIQIAPTVFYKFTHHDELEQAFREAMYDAALRDPLTGVFNKRYFKERLVTEWAYSVRHDAPLSLVMMDLDHFKRVNDTHGHPAGDAVLKRFAEVVADSIRTEDVLCRYGGEEFTVICREFPVPSAEIMGERIRKTVEETTFEYAGEIIPVTVSAGLSGVPHPSIESTDALVEAADAALYTAKRGGRNRVCMYDPDAGPDR